MTSSNELPYRKTVAVLATMHGKEHVIVPLLEEGLGLRVGLALGLNTDRFGTFSRDIERTGSQLDAARAKIAAAFDLAPYARVGVASEGSFGPHPIIPFLPHGRAGRLLLRQGGATRFVRPASGVPPGRGARRRRGGSSRSRHAPPR